MARRKPFCIRQNDPSDCGAAALATVARTYGLSLSVAQVRELCGTDREGTNLLGLIDGADRIGLQARGVQASYDALQQVPLPAIAHGTIPPGVGHFVVVHRASRTQVVVADPARGMVTMTRDEFVRFWSGKLLLAIPKSDLPNPGDASSPSPWRRFFTLLRPHGSVLLEAFLCAVLFTLLGIGTSFFIQHLVDSVLVHGETRLLNLLGVGMVILLVFRALLGAFRQYLLAHIGRKVDVGLIGHFIHRVLRLPMKFFEMRQVGEILSRIRDAVKIRQAVGSTTLTAVVDVTLIVVSVVVMLFYQWNLALVAGAFIPLFLAIMAVHHPATRRVQRRAMEDGAALDAKMVEDVSGVEAIKAFGAERRREDQAGSALVRFVRSAFRSQLLVLSSGSLGMFITSLAGIAILWYGGHLVIERTLTIGELMFFYTLMGFMLQPLERLATVNSQMQDAVIALDRLGEVLDLELEAGEAEHGKAEFQGIRRDVTLRNLTFRYGCREEVLRQIDLDLPAGTTTALVGESGGGKTTLAKLLTRLYEPTAGSISIDGVDIRDFALESYRGRIGLVSQDPFVFNATIHENIACSRPNATNAEVVEAARAAGLHDFIESLPLRYRTVVGERGANLSGGQRQRLAIARAVLRKPDLLIFDEATSHLDTETERALQKSLVTALAGRTVLLIAHRLSTIRSANQIAVLHDGRIVERGTHAELMERDGRYAALWRHQQIDGDSVGRVAEVGHAA